MNLIKIFTLFLSNFVSSQPMMGSQHDEHNCVSDGGYSWCESTQECIRQWETPCKDHYTNCNDCLQRQRNGENIACPVSCDNIMIQNPCSIGCPPPVPCPAPGPNCNYIPPLVDNCGCSNGCGTINCHPIDPIPPSPPITIPLNCATWFDGCNTCGVDREGRLNACTMMMCFRQGIPECKTYYINSNENECINDNDCPTQFCRPKTTNYNGPKECVDYAQKNDPCGGYTLPNSISRCSPDFECVNIMGNMIADAPGQCRDFCHNTIRDQKGNCIDSNCKSWFDGCNICLVGSNGELGCTELFCEETAQAHCMDTTKLYLNDVCYQFCEDGSQPFINKRNLCPTGSTCSSSQLSEISFDNCGDRALRCLSGN